MTQENIKESVKNAKRIFVFGGLYFDKLNGNTYCNSKCVTDNGQVFYIGYHYGYGNAYFTQAETFIKNINNDCIVQDIGNAHYKKSVVKNSYF